MFVVMNRFYVKPEYAAQFEARIQNRPRLVEQQPGFIRVQLLRPMAPTDPYIVLTLWQSQADFEAWVKADTFTARHAGPRTLSADIFVRPNQVETFTVSLDSVEKSTVST
jgi:heme oxygenase (mycobilin-producing)